MENSGEREADHLLPQDAEYLKEYASWPGFYTKQIIARLANGHILPRHLTQRMHNSIVRMAQRYASERKHSFRGNDLTDVVIEAAAKMSGDSVENISAIALLIKGRDQLIMQRRLEGMRDALAVAKPTNRKKYGQLSSLKGILKR